MLLTLKRTAKKLKTRTWVIRAAVRAGILHPARYVPRGGRRYKRLFDLADVYAAVPEIDRAIQAGELTDPRGQRRRRPTPAPSAPSPAPSAPSPDADAGPNLGAFFGRPVSRELADALDDQWRLEVEIRNREAADLPVPDSLRAELEAARRRAYEASL